MPKYKIARVYEVLAQDRIEATDRLMEAIACGDEKLLHVYDVIRPSDDPDKTGTGATGTTDRMDETATRAAHGTLLVSVRLVEVLVVARHGNTYRGFPPSRRKR